MMTDPSPDAFIARILGPDGRPVGVGALVSEAARGDVRSCGECGTRARPRDARVWPGSPCRVDFPLLGSGGRGGSPRSGHS